MAREPEIFRAYSFDKWLFIATIVLIVFGLIMVFSSSVILASEKYNQAFHFLFNQAIGAALGLIGIFFMLSIKKPFYQSPHVIYGMLAFSGALLSVCLAMPAIEKTNRWIQISGIRFQPSEIAKLSLILFLADHLSRKQGRISELKSLAFPLGVLFFLILLIIREPDYGTAILIFGIGTAMLYLGGVKFRYFIYLGGVSAALFGFYLFQASYRLQRILAFLSPTKDPLGSGFQIIQSKLAVGAGGLLGVSLGESTQKLFFLPCAHTDYIYAIIGEELGLLGTLSILILFCIILWRGILISLRAPDTFCRLVAAGLTLAILGQALLNISIVLGLGPPTGLPLPLISFGRSSLICTLLSIGILLHISQRKESTRARI